MSILHARYFECLVCVILRLNYMTLNPIVLQMRRACSSRARLRCEGYLSLSQFGRILLIGIYQ